MKQDEYEAELKVLYEMAKKQGEIVVAITVLEEIGKLTGRTEKTNT